MQWMKRNVSSFREKIEQIVVLEFLFLASVLSVHKNFLTYLSLTLAPQLSALVLAQRKKLLLCSYGVEKHCFPLHENFC